LKPPRIEGGDGSIPWIFLMLRTRFLRRMSGLLERRRRKGQGTKRRVPNFPLWPTPLALISRKW